MLNAAIILFALAAAGGATLAYMRIVKKDVNLPLAIGHGILAATGLVLLIMTVVRTGGTGLTAALIAFLAAAIGGFVLLSFHLRMRPMPVPLVLVHGGVAVTAFVILLITLFG
jgi:hypothetical protein